MTNTEIDKPTVFRSLDNLKAVNKMLPFNEAKSYIQVLFRLDNLTAKMLVGEWMKN